MDIKTYIESGIIEKFVLGRTSQEESAILECVMSNNSEVKNAILELQQTLELLANLNVVEPPQELKGQIFAKLDFSKKNTEGLPVIENTSNVGSDPVVQQQEEFSVGKRYNTTLWLSAASILLLVAFGWNMFKMQKMEKSLADSRVETAETQKQVEFFANQNQIILNSKNIQLKGVEKHPGMLANVIWDQASIVHLSVENLPKAPAGKQYQLWAIVDGKPVDVGMYNESEGKMQEMKLIKSAQAFAITLEKEGGSETPTMEEMYVMGEV